MQLQEDHLRHLKLLIVLSPRTEKKSAVEKGDGSTSRSKQREGQKEITRFCSINCKFSIFLFCLMQ